MRPALRIPITVLATLLAFGAGGQPSIPAPSVERPISVKCTTGLATLKLKVLDVFTSSREEAFTLQGWPTSRGKTFAVAVADWDDTLLLKTHDGTEMKGGKVEVPSEKPLEITARRVKGQGPIKFTLTLFGDSTCTLPVARPQEGI